ncbi:octopamine receptor-like [Ostrea edulis]|uniref:octopamine receptor-like n=1 Tax=Ostrea edulis TaxID=37623 RepID=UPI00209538BD|nr:octopamine receptor-like [Ostrea edulis]
MSDCTFNSTTVNFLEATSDLEKVTKWLRFCKAAYVDKCDMYSLKPPLFNLSFLYSEATEEDCLDTKQLTAYCISMILSILIILANSVILGAFVYGRNRLLKSSNIPIISLALSDLLTGITFLYSSTWNLIILDAGYDFDLMKIQQYTSLRANYYLCLTLDGPGFVFACMMSSVLSLSVIATDRYLAIFHSYRYHFWITTPRMVFSIIIIWIISLIVSVVPLLGWNNWSGTCQLTEVMHYDYLVLWSSICFICGFLILFIYLRIFIVARKHSRQIEAQVTSTSSTSENVPAEPRMSKDLTTMKSRNTTSGSLRSSKSTVDYLEDSGCHDVIEMNNMSTQESNTLEPRNKEKPSDEDQVQEKSDQRKGASPETGTSNSQKENEHKSEDVGQSKTPENKTTADDASSGTKRQETRKSTGATVVFIKDSKNPSRTSNKQVDKKRFQKPSMKAVRTTAMILGAFYLCWTPLLVYLLLKVQDQFHNLMVYYLFVVTQLNSLFNPLVYGFRQSDIKATLHRMRTCQKAY